MMNLGLTKIHLGICDKLVISNAKQITSYWTAYYLCSVSQSTTKSLL